MDALNSKYNTLVNYGTYGTETLVSRAVEYVYKTTQLPCAKPFTNSIGRGIKSLYNYTAPVWIQKTGQVCWPHLNPIEKKNVIRFLLGVGTIGAIFANNGYLNRWFNRTQENMAQVLNVDEDTPVDEEAFDSQLYQMMFALGGWTLGYPALFAFEYSFISSLTNAIRVSVLRQWIRSGAYNGLNYLPVNNKKFSTGLIIQRDINAFAQHTAQHLTSFCELIFGLWAAYESFMKIEDNIVFAYALGIVITIWTLSKMAGRKLQSISREQKEYTEEATNKLAHLDTYSESVAILKGSQHEERSILGSIQKAYTREKHVNAIRSVLGLTSVISGAGSFALGFLLMRKQLINKTATLPTCYAIGEGVQSMVNIFLWGYNNYATITLQEGAAERIQMIQAHTEQWAEASQQSETYISRKICRPDEPTSFNGTVRTPTGETLFSGYIELIPGAITCLSGDSGCGKSTLIRVLAGLWPHAEGTLTAPENTLTLPQTAYMAEGDAPLLESIAYPADPKDIDADTIEDIKTLMDKFNLPAKLSQHLTERSWKEIQGDNEVTVSANWSKSLSGGEKQRISLIGAIIQEPDLLVLDESMTAIDKTTRSVIEKELKALAERGTTIVFVDHNTKEDSDQASHNSDEEQAAPFHDHNINIQEIQSQYR